MKKLNAQLSGCKLIVSLVLFCFFLVGGQKITFAADVTGKDLDKVIDSLVSEWKKQATDKKLTYTWFGYINTNGKLTGDKKGLACNSFAAPVLAKVLLNGDYRILKGDGESRGGKDYKWTHQWFGNDAATYFGLSKSLTAETLSSFITKANSGKLSTGVFYFDLRNQKAKKRSYYIKENGKLRLPNQGEIGASHTGFIVISKKGNKNTVEMRHFSELKAFNGLAKGDFIEKFLKKSLYGKSVTARSKSDITLYKLKTIKVAKIATMNSPLSLREKPAKGSMLITKMAKGHFVQALDIKKDWTKCRYMINGAVKIGWAATRYLKFD